MHLYNKAFLIAKKLSDGNIYSCNHLSKYANISLKDIDTYINILNEWGLKIDNTYKKYFRINYPIYLINKNYLNYHLKKKSNNSFYFFATIDSTNQYLINNIKVLKSGDICVSEHQQNGRGRYGKFWYSPFGCNLYFSIYWNLKCDKNSSMCVSLVIAITIAKTLQKLGIKNIRLKWPNDIYILKNKLGGILIENIKNNNPLIQKIIIGIGINCLMNNLSSYQINYNWTSLQLYKKNINKNILLLILINKIKKNLIKFEKKGLNPFIKKWLELDDYLNKSVNLIINNKIISGIYKGINSLGALILEEKNNKISYWNIGELSLRIK